jgi:Uma2 family endonuclease
MTVMTRPAPTTKAPNATIPSEPIFRLSVKQYHRMIRTGILTDGDPVELLEGWLVQKMSKNPPHRVVTLLLRRALEGLISAGWYVDSQEPITTADSEPEPDVVVVRGDTLDYLNRHPGPQDVGLVIEIAQATLKRDRGLKKRIYARAGISVYWLVDLVKKQIEVYTSPLSTGEKPDYQEHRVYSHEDTIPVMLDGVEIGQIAVWEVLP